ncbi:MAG: Enoyl-CoA hydratase/isomerase, partial [Tardiphaga sp.]|nr:Enoyl-CoA hydratase/isomerase [Tardiphaga sp.]
MTTYKDIAVEIKGHIAIIEIRKPPYNFFDILLIQQIADALDEIDANPELRAT